MSSLADSIAGVFDSDTFVPSDLQNRLDDFTTAGVNTINVTQFRQQIGQEILLFNTTSEIERLESLRTELNDLVGIIQLLILCLLPLFFLQMLSLIPGAEPQRDAIVDSINITIIELMSIDGVVTGLNSVVVSRLTIIVIFAS